MSVAIRQIRVYFRGAVVVLVVLIIGMVLVKNRNHEVQFWFFGLTDDTKPVNVVWLLLCTAIATLITWWVIALGWRLIRDVREMKKERALRMVTTTLEKRTAELDARERRIDEKLQRAVGDDVEDVEKDEAGE